MVGSRVSSSKRPSSERRTRRPSRPRTRESFQVGCGKSVVRSAAAAMIGSGIAFGVDVQRCRPAPPQGRRQGVGDGRVVDPGQGRLGRDRGRSAGGAAAPRTVSSTSTTLSSVDIRSRTSRAAAICRGIVDARFGVDLGGHGGDHRRSRRRLDDLEEGAVLGRRWRVSSSRRRRVIGWLCCCAALLAARLTRISARCGPWRR